MSICLRWIGLTLLWIVSMASVAENVPEFEAKAWLLYEYNSGQVLAEKAADTQVEPASLTKLMTAYLVFEALKQKKITLNDKANISAQAQKQRGSRTFLLAGSNVTVEDLIKGLIIQSGNDAAWALAEYVGGSVESFVELMNRKAKQLGLAQTTYKNPHGLPAEGHLSSARDLMKLSRALIADFPNYYTFYSMREFRYNNITQANRNKLLNIDPSVDGIKTGFTDEAGYCLIASAVRPASGVQRRLISVLLGSHSPKERFRDSQLLLNWGFRNYSLLPLFAKDAVVSSQRVWKGTETEVALIAGEDLAISIQKEQLNQVKAVLEKTEPLIAPIQQGQKLATLHIKIADTTIASFPLLAQKGVEQAGMIGRAIDSIKLWWASY